MAINILMPLAGKSAFFDSPEYQYPKPLVEIAGKSMLELGINNLMTIFGEKKFIFVTNAQDCTRYHLDNIVRLLTNEQCAVLKLNGETQGAVCSALMAIEHINNDEELIIANSDQLFDEDLNVIINTFRSRAVDAGVICFETIHPRWSYVRLNAEGKIMESAEKNPISKEAIAGFYYFKRGDLFVAAAMKVIEKDASVNGAYFIAPVLNELVLENKNLERYKIDNEKYHTFYSPQKIQEYEQRKQQHR